MRKIEQLYRKDDPTDVGELAILGPLTDAGKAGLDKLNEIMRDTVTTLLLLHACGHSALRLVFRGDEGEAEGHAAKELMCPRCASGPH